jgi:hypothetical protein
VNQFADQLAMLADLADDELSQLEQEMVSAFDEADAAGDVDTMSDIADGLDAVRGEVARRGGDAEETMITPDEEPAMAASAETDAVEENAETDVVEETEVTTASVEASEETDEVIEITAEAEEIVADGSEVEAETEETDSEIVASIEEESPNEENNMSVELTADDAAETVEEAVTASAPLAVIRAGGDIPGVAAGSELTDFDAVANALTSRINSLRGTGGDGEQVVVASIATDLDPERTLFRSDPEGNSRKIRGIQSDPAALTAAANGWCAPRTPLYQIAGVGSNDRPVQASLPAFNADRGGVVYSAAPSLADGSYGAGKWSWVTDEWTGSATTADGALSSKVSFTPTCPSEVTSDLYAVTSQLKFDNSVARAYPELVRRNMELAQVAHARFAESILLGRMDSAATNVGGGATPPLGVARDYMFKLRVIATSLRNRHRVAPDTTLDAWAPYWLRDAIILDLAAQAPGDGTISATYGEIEGYLAAANINVTWFHDDVPGADQLFASDGAFPANARTILAPAGSFLYLDGGTMDLGVVRDASLVGTNQYIEFTETFEGLAFVGVEAIKFNTEVNVIGGTALGIDTSTGIIVD